MPYLHKQLNVENYECLRDKLFYQPMHGNMSLNENYSEAFTSNWVLVYTALKYIFILMGISNNYDSQSKTSLMQSIDFWIKSIPVIFWNAKKWFDRCMCENNR